MTAFVRELVDRASVPLVLDADALNAFADEPAALVGREGRDIIITPHPGEMARLVGGTVDEVQANRLDIARDFAVDAPRLRGAQGPPHADRHAGRQGLHQSDRQCRAWRPAAPATCSPGMIAAWLAQLLDAEAACRLAVYLHGAAGDLADADKGEVSMTAGDLAEHIGDAILELTARRRVAPQKPE